MTDKITRGRGNVFRDLGFEHPAEEQAKAQLVCELRAIIKNRRLTQIKAGEIIGLSQSNLSNLLRGRARHGYTIECLCRFIMALDRDIEIRIKKRPRSRHESRFEVRGA